MDEMGRKEAAFPPDGNASEEQQRDESLEKGPEFQGFVECRLFSGEAKIKVNGEGLYFGGLFDQLFVPYGEVRAFAQQEYAVEIEGAGGVVKVSRLGIACQWFYDAFYRAFNKKVLSSLLVKGGSGFEAAAGCYQAFEARRETAEGRAAIRLYEECLCILPPGDMARRIPLSFVHVMEKEDYSLALTLLTGEKYVLSRLGLEMAPLAHKITHNLQALREKSLKGIRELDGALSSMQEAAAAKLMPDGVQACAKALEDCSPSLVSALEEAGPQGRIAESFPVLVKLCGTKGVFLGRKAQPKAQASGEPAGGLAGEPGGRGIPGQGPGSGLPLEDGGAALGAAPQGGETAEEPPAEGLDFFGAPAAGGALVGGEAQSGGNRDGGSAVGAEASPQPLVWITAVSRDGRTAALELDLPGNEAAATYIFRVKGDPKTFALLINRGMEAADFHRDLVTLSEEELAEPAHLDSAMLIRRTPALGLLRECFLKRIIHASPESWRREIQTQLGEESLRAGEALESSGSKPQEDGLKQDGLKQDAFCIACGTRLAASAKYCGRCGRDVRCHGSGDGAKG